MTEKTFGQFRVRTHLNTNSSPLVGDIKSLSAQLIDTIDRIAQKLHPDDDQTLNSEILRLVKLSQTAIEEGAMWAEKALTMDL